MAKENSGSGKGSNTNLDPTLKEREAEHGRSGEAITGDKKAGGQPSRESARNDPASG